MSVQNSVDAACRWCGARWVVILVGGCLINMNLCVIYCNLVIEKEGGYLTAR